MMNIEDNLKEIIEVKFGNVKTFAEKIDLPYTTVRSILQRGVMNAKVENVIKIADGLNMKAEDLMSLDNTQSIFTIYNQLDQKRQAKVYNFADRQLREQKYGIAGKIVPLKPRKKIPVDIYGRLSAGGGAGFGVLFGPTGGFLIGFIFNGLVTGSILDNTKKNYFWAVIANIVGAMVTLAFGTAWLKFGTGMEFIAALKTGFIPFIIPGIIKAVACGILGIFLLRRLPQRYFAPIK